MEDRFPAGTYRVILGMSRVENYSIKRRPAFAETPGAAEDPEIARIRSTLLADVSAEAPGNGTSGQRSAARQATATLPESPGQAAPDVSAGTPALADDAPKVSQP